jgi:hypothetical protein
MKLTSGDHLWWNEVLHVSRMCRPCRGLPLRSDRFPTAAAVGYDLPPPRGFSYVKLTYFPIRLLDRSEGGAV